MICMYSQLILLRCYRLGKQLCLPQYGYIQVWSVCVQRLSGSEVLVIKKHKMGSFSSQDCNSIGQDRKCRQVGRATVKIQSCGGLVKYQT